MDINPSYFPLLSLCRNGVYERWPTILWVVIVKQVTEILGLFIVLPSLTANNYFHHIDSFDLWGTSRVDGKATHFRTVTVTSTATVHVKKVRRLWSCTKHNGRTIRFYNSRLHDRSTRSLSPIKLRQFQSASYRWEDLRNSFSHTIKNENIDGILLITAA